MGESSRARFPAQRDFPCLWDRLMTLLSSLPPQIASFAEDVFRLCIWLVLLIAIFVPLERLFAQRPSTFLRPQIGNDLAYYFLSSLLPAALMSLPLAVLATLVQKVLPSG